MGDIAKREAILKQKLQALSDEELKQYKENSLRYVREHLADGISEDMQAVIIAIRKEYDRREELTKAMSTETVWEMPVIDLEPTQRSVTTQRVKSSESRRKPKRKIFNKKLLAGVVAACVVLGAGTAIKKAAEHRAEEPASQVEEREVDPIEDEWGTAKTPQEFREEINPTETTESPEIGIENVTDHSTDPSEVLSTSDSEFVEDIVYITETGTKYHRGSCRWLEHSKIEISKSEAISQGYTACGTCY